MIAYDYHVHSVFSDGVNTLEEVAAAACERGVKILGFTDHGYAPYDTYCCMRRENVPVYRETCRKLKETYAGRMEVYCGIEQDIFSEESTDGYDYVIGSVHYLFLTGEYLTVDWKRERLERATALLGGDMLRVAEEYYRIVSQVTERTCCQLIGHFDLISKLNEREHLFDENDPRYIEAWQQAADALLKAGVPFEINTGAISRGYKTEAYPAAPIRRYLRDRGASFVLSSDSHNKETLQYDFERYERVCRKEGLTLLDRLEWRKEP